MGRADERGQEVRCLPPPDACLLAFSANPGGLQCHGGPGKVYLCVCVCVIHIGHMFILLLLFVKSSSLRDYSLFSLNLFEGETIWDWPC